jgi:hypothetical protein
MGLFVFVLARLSCLDLPVPFPVFENMTNRRKGTKKPRKKQPRKAVVAKRRKEQHTTLSA